jgi:hypothetical protein
VKVTAGPDEPELASLLLPLLLPEVLLSLAELPELESPSSPVLASSPLDPPASPPDELPLEPASLEFVPLLAPEELPEPVEAPLDPLLVPLPLEPVLEPDDEPPVESSLLQAERTPAATRARTPISLRWLVCESIGLARTTMAHGVGVSLWAQTGLLHGKRYSGFKSSRPDYDARPHGGDRATVR